MNVNKPCASCSKVVYPLERIKCFDQIWHRQCFRCSRCGMALSICNYCGFEKKPYCAAHTPKLTKFTVIPDTPELLRVAQNTRVFSNIKYGEAARRARGSAISVTDDLYSQHHRKLTRQLSEAAYRQSSGRSSAMDGTNYSSRCNSRFSSFMVQSPFNRNGVSTTGSVSPFYHSNGHMDGGSLHHYTSASALSRLGGDSPQVDQSEPRKISSSHSFTSVIQPSEVQQLENRVNEVENSFGSKFRAIYDYEAREDDEVTFIEGDIILNGDPITEGWMYGTVQRTGKFGMLPSNYVERIR